MPRSPDPVKKRDIWLNEADWRQFRKMADERRINRSELLRQWIWYLAIPQDKT